MSKGGDTDINWQLFDPNGNELQSGHRVNTASHFFNVTVGGAYQICLDNTFTSEYKVVTLVLENDLPDEMQMLLGKIATNDPNLPQGFKVSGSPAN